MKQELYKQVRHRYNLPPQEGKCFFSKNELSQIVEKIYGEPQDWTQSYRYMTDYLEEHGWTKQATVDTHPSRENLRWLLSAPLNVGTETNPNTSLSLQFVLDSMSPEVMDKLTSISVDQEERTVTLQF